MNIFFTDPCPIQCAKNLDTKRMIKMTLESAQLLSTALNSYGVSVGYRPTHKNHPISIWVRQSRENYLWLLEHFKALLQEFTERRGKIHACSALLTTFIDGVNSLPSLGLTPKPNCAANKEKGVSYKHIDDVYTAYKLYLSDRWDTDKIEPTWS